MKVITTGLLNRFWTKGIKPWLDKRIKSYADLMVTTASGYTPDALAVKEGFTELNGKLQTANLYLGDIIKVSANVTTIGWHNNDINISTAAKIDGYEFVEYILSADTYRISGISHSGSSITYYVNTVGTSANINCIPLYKRL